MGSLFGTDGIRGTANTHPMTAEVALRVGRAVARLLRAERVVIGQDTRLSGDMITHGLVAGICSAGADVELLGILPTPGIAVLTRARGAAAGIVVSASHNPYQDNGIKIFGADGFKLSDETEAAIEAAVASDRPVEDNCSGAHRIGRVQTNPEAEAAYCDFLRTCIPPTAGPNGFNIILDCAHGATYRVAPQVFAERGASVTSLNVHPDGRNINRDCGSQHLQGLKQAVVRGRADVGLAFDGDGDRLIAVDETGDAISGDRILAICAGYLHRGGRLRNRTVVSTVMSNASLGRALRTMGVRHVLTQVGDRHVMEAMRREGAVLGGEDSGHLILAERHTTGDGLLTGLLLLEVLQAEGKPLSQLKSIMTPFPQVLLNVAVRSKPPLEEVPDICEAIRKAQSELGADGRVLIRYSGTEPLCRVMVEGPTKQQTEGICAALAKTVRAAIG
jgi:phosphoglucosamine mutase